MNYTEAIKRPFTDFKKLLIGILISIIPIINFFASGYILECARTAMKKKYKLPEWENWGNLFIRGLLMFVISLLYMIPFMLIFMLLGGLTILKSFMKLGFKPQPSDITSLLPTIGTGIMLSLLVLLITFYILPLAILSYAKKERFADAFNINDIFKKAFNSQYFSAWIVAVIIYIGLGIIFNFIPFIGSAINSFVSGVILFTILGEVYPKLK